MLKQLERFDAILVHGDPAVITLDETFGPVDRIDIPLVYTGYITPRPPPHARVAERKRLGLLSEDRLVVVSAGGGKVGAPLMKAAAAAFGRLSADPHLHLHLIAGPYGDADLFQALMDQAGGRLTVQRFNDRFLELLTAADLSVSMGGYNTCMNLLSAQVPRALIWPFAQNREQGLRVERLMGLAPFLLLAEKDLTAKRFAQRVRRLLDQPPGSTEGVRLDGAEVSARWISDWFASTGKGAAP